MNLYTGVTILLDYVTTDNEALNAFFELLKTEGIIPTIESSHAVAHAIKFTKTLTKD